MHESGAKLIKRRQNSVKMRHGGAAIESEEPPINKTFGRYEEVNRQKLSDMDILAHSMESDESNPMLVADIENPKRGKTINPLNRELRMFEEDISGSVLPMTKSNHRNSKSELAEALQKAGTDSDRAGGSTFVNTEDERDD